MAIDPVCGMKVSEKTGIKLVYKEKTYYFCCQKCLEKFSKEHSISEKEISCCSARSSKKWYYNKIFIISVLLIFIILLSYFVNFLYPLRNSLFMYISKIWWAVVLGLFIGGTIDYFIPREYISHVLARRKKRTILYSVLLGFLMAACSHGILAISIALHKKGASTPAVISFLLASPWANLPLTILLIGFFGIKAFFIIISAILIAIITGFIYQFLERINIIPTNKNIAEVKEDFSILLDIKKRLHAVKFNLDTLLKSLRGVFDSSVSLANMVLWWILLGFAIASVLAAYVPSSLFQTYMGPGLPGLFVTLLLATVIEVCSEGTAPLAFEIYRQTSAIGNVFVFLMAGVVTDYTEIGLLWSNVGKKEAILLPIITVPQVIILGIIANYIF